MSKRKLELNVTVTLVEGEEPESTWSIEGAATTLETFGAIKIAELRLRGILIDAINKINSKVNESKVQESTK